jgi:hypothetical protein
MIEIVAEPLPRALPLPEATLLALLPPAPIEAVA